MAGRSVGWMSRKWVLRFLLTLVWALLVFGSGCCSLFVRGSDEDAIGEIRVRRGRREEVSIVVSPEGSIRFRICLNILEIQSCR